MKEKNKNKKQTITHEEIQHALKKFQAEGGLITRLPDQVAPVNKLVGSRWSMYETISDTSSGPEPKNN